MNLEIKGFSKKYGEKVVFDNFDLTIGRSEIVVLLGDSGVGKTTLLNYLAGLDDDKPSLSCSYIFQEPRLLKGVTVKKNVYLACHDLDLTLKTLNDVELSNAQDLYPDELSGGMAQRASMARAFVARRDLILMDEPFSSLDIRLKYRLYDIFRKLWQENKPAVVLVTHDLDEAMELGDRVVVLKGNPASVVLDEKVKENDRETLKTKIREVIIG